MTTALERHHKDVKIAFMTCRKETDKELDMRLGKVLVYHV